MSITLEAKEEDIRWGQDSNRRSPGATKKVPTIVIVMKLA